MDMLPVARYKTRYGLLPPKMRDLQTFEVSVVSGLVTLAEPYHTRVSILIEVQL
jgi:hypothetical protein